MFGNVVQVLKKTFNMKSNSRQEKLDEHYYDQEPEEYDSAVAKGVELTPGEFKAAVFTLFLSLSIVGCKIMFRNRETVHSMYAKRKDLQLHFSDDMPIWFEGSLETMENTWSNWRCVLMPLLWSLFFTFYSWFIVHKNIRRVPGVDTPTPLTPSGYQDANVGGTFYLDYCLPLVISSCGFLLMLYLSHL